MATSMVLVHPRTQNGPGENGEKQTSGYRYARPDRRAIYGIPCYQSSHEINIKKITNLDDFPTPS